MHSLVFLFHTSNFKGNEDNMDIQQKINSAKYKILLGSMKDDMAMISFNYCFRNDTCPLDFIANWI
jgi:hypothetical protein